MKERWRGLLAIILILAIAVQLMPATAFATGNNDIVIVEDREETGDKEELASLENYYDEELLLVDEGECLSGDGKKTYHAEDVLWENRDLRDPGTKHFHLSDGTDVAIVYQEPVHYMDDSGIYQDIDNTLELVDREKEYSVQRLSDKEPVLIPSTERIESTITIEEENDILVEEEESNNIPAKAVSENEFDVQDAKDSSDVEEAETKDISSDLDVVTVNTDIEIVEEKLSDKQEEPKDPFGKEYRNRAGLVDVRLAELSNADGLVSLSDGKNILRFTPAWDIAEKPASLLESEFPYDSDSFEAAIMPRNLSAGLRYEEILPGVDLEYWVQQSGIKENIILREPLNTARFSFVMDCGGLIPEFTDDGSIGLFDAEGNCMMIIPAGYMTDAKGAYSEDVDYELEDQGEGFYLLTVQADEVWLKDVERAYPVIIDPSARVYGVTHYVIETATIQNRTPSSTAGQSAESYIGGKYYYDTGIALMRTLVRINTTPELPANSVLVNASFHYRARQLSATGLSSLTITARALSSNTPGSSGLWCIGKSWNTTPAPESQILDYATIGSGGQFYDWDITRYAQKWYEDSSLNYGFVLMAINESSFTNTSNAWVVFDSSTSATSVQPYFEIQYRNTVGLEDYYTYQSHSIDRAGVGYISDVGRQLTIVKSDVACASTVRPFELSHVYNSAYSSGEFSSQIFNSGGRYYYMSLGKGWKLSAEQTCSYHTNGYLTYSDADGTIHFLKQVGGAYSNTFYDEDGLGLTVVASSSDGTFGANTNYTMTDLYGNTKYFASGWLTYEQDANGNRITYNRNSSDRISSIVRKNSGESNETLATLSYSGNYLSSITDSAGNTTSFTYSGGCLVMITHPDGTTVSYTYDSNGRLLTAKDNESSYSMTYTYDNHGRISSYTEKAGSTTGVSVSVSGSIGIRTYRYCGKDRTLNNSDDLISGYVFDYLGRTITSYTSDYNEALIYSAFGGKYTNNSGTTWSNNRLKIGGSVGFRPTGNSTAYISNHPNLLTYGVMKSSTPSTLTGSPTTENYLDNTLTAAANDDTKISPDATQTYLFSGWAKADSVPIKEGSNRSYELRATVRYTDNTTDTQAVSYCTDSTEWQYAVLPIVPKYPNKTVYKITVGFYYNYNANSAQFKLGCLTKEAVASYEWNSNGDLVSVATPSNATQTYSYSGADLIQQVTMGNGTFNYTYDSHHNVTGVSNSGLSMALSYDTKGNATSSTLTGGSLQMSSSATYTNNGNLIATQTDTRGKTTSYTYGNNISKQLGQPTAVTDPKSVTVNTSYNTSNGRVTGSSMTGVSLGYTYGNGCLTAMTRTVGSAGQTYNMGYNGFGQLASVKVGTRSLASYTYASNNGVLMNLTYGNGNTVGYAYDNLERVTNVYYNNSSSPAYAYAYYGEGTLKSLTDSVNNRSYDYSYDSLNRLTGYTEKQGSNTVQSYTATYDTANRLTSLYYQVSPSWNGTLTNVRDYGYYYNTDGSLWRLTTPSCSLFYSYDGLKRQSNMNLSVAGDAKFSRQYQYLAGAGNNTSTLISNVTFKKPDGTQIRSYGYSYDAVGNITAISGDTTESYTYDSQNQMTKAVLNGTTYNYSYDAAGNILSKTKTSGSGTDTFTYGNTEWRDLLTAYNGNSISYDTVGNPTTWYDGATMTWVNGKRLSGISATSDHAALSFTYDSDGLRLTKTAGTGSSAVEHKYIWQGGNLVSEQYGSTQLEFTYDENNRPNSIRINGYLYYFITNIQGDVLAILSRNGTLCATYEYNAWGEVLSVNDLTSDNIGTINPIRYRGYYFDSESGFYYLKSRYYDPQICRFINADGLASTGQGFLGTNMFAYCLNNPVLFADPDGQDADIAVFIPESYIYDAARVIGSAALAVGFLAATYYLKRTSVVYGRYLLAELSKKTSSSTSATKVSVSSPAQPSGPNKPNNDRKFNVRKNESPQWDKLDRVKNSKLRTSGSGSQQRYYDWDYTHNDIEVYDHLGRHLGSMDPVTGEIYKGPVGRTISVH